MWPGLKAHWRNRHNSPLTGYDQGHIIGGGSSVMGMVALRGIPEDYNEWDALGARGWAWTDVLPYFRKLENDFDFADGLHGRDGPTPIRRMSLLQNVTPSLVIVAWPKNLSVSACVVKSF